MDKAIEQLIARLDEIPKSEQDIIAERLNTAFDAFAIQDGSTAGTLECDR